jgi:hypothetical protein
MVQVEARVTETMMVLVTVAAAASPAAASSSAAASEPLNSLTLEYPGRLSETMVPSFRGRAGISRLSGRTV